MQCYFQCTLHHWKSFVAVARSQIRQSQSEKFPKDLARTRVPKFIERFGNGPTTSHSGRSKLSGRFPRLLLLIGAYRSRLDVRTRPRWRHSARESLATWIYTQKLPDRFITTGKCLTIVFLCVNPETKMYRGSRVFFQVERYTYYYPTLSTRTVFIINFGQFYFCRVTYRFALSNNS